jgi:hypothetical protein
MLVPGDPGGLGTPIYVFAVESPQPVGARHTSCTQLLWKPHDPSREDTPIYLVTFETSRLMGARNTSCKQLLWKPRNPSREGAPIYLVTFETSRPMGQGKVHVSSYCGNPAIQAVTFENSRPVGAMNTTCTQLLRKPRDPSRQGTRISVVTAETE